MNSTLTRRVCLTCLAAGTAGLLTRTSAARARSRRLLCSFSARGGWSHSPASDYTVLRVATPDDPSGVPQVVRRLCDALSFQSDFTIEVTQGQDNASTWMENGQRVIAADVDFLLNVNRWASTRWAAIQVLGHEIGHHMARLDDPHQNELEADYWSGWALRRLGAARSVASASILAIGTEEDTETHPNRHRRAVAIASGWDNAG